MVHEFRSSGMPVSFASTNCRDPFHAYGDYNMMEAYREVLRIAQPDHPFGDWTASITATPAASCGFTDRGRSRFKDERSEGTSSLICSNLARPGAWLARSVNGGYQTMRVDHG
jgi:hypothetical protein